MTAAPETYALARTVSRILGWIYTLSWSLSFYPQPIHNYQRRTTQGLAFDFPTANVLGFTSYTTFTDRLVGNRLVGDRLVEHRLVGGRLVEDRLVEDKLVEDRLVKGRLVGDRLVGGRLVEDRVIISAKID